MFSIRLARALVFEFRGVTVFVCFPLVYREDFSVVVGFFRFCFLFLVCLFVCCFCCCFACLFVCLFLYLLLFCFVCFVLRVVSVHSMFRE